MNLDFFFFFIMNNTNIFVVLRNILVEKTSSILTNNLVPVNKDDYLSSHPKHFFHIVDPSPWAFLYINSCIMLLHYQVQLLCMLFCSRILWFFIIWTFIFIIYFILSLFRDVIFEGTVEGCHD